MAEIPVDEMGKRWHHKTMQEYGFAVEVVGPNPLDDFKRHAAKQVIERNFEVTAREHPEYNLTDWSFVTAPVRQAYNYETCGLCDGSKVSLVNDGGDYYDEVTCRVCDGVGSVPTTPIEGVYHHSFGWYAIAPINKENQHG